MNKKHRLHIALGIAPRIFKVTQQAVLIKVTPSHSAFMNLSPRGTYELLHSYGGTPTAMYKNMQDGKLWYIDLDKLYRAIQKGAAEIL